MEPFVIEKCANNKCEHKATIINNESYHYCLSCLANGSTDEIKGLRKRLYDLKDDNLTGSIFDGRSKFANHFYQLPLNDETKQGADFRGSIFISVNLSSEDFEKTDFSFCNFIGCDLRRIRLYNSSLRWTRFHKSLLKQADINNSDCRWMQAQSVIKNEEIDNPDQALGILQEKSEKENKFPLHDIRPIDIRCLFYRFGIIITEKEVNTYSEPNGIVILREKARKCQGDNELQKFISSFETEIATSTNWSGGSITNSDLSHAWFDEAEAVEASFDGSDLYQTSFKSAKLNRSSFRNASFSRLESSEGEEINNGRFEGAEMNGCLLQGTNLEKIYFKRTKLNNANLKSAYINKAVFYNCKIKDAVLDDVVAEECKFINSNLSGSSLIGIVLNKTRFFSSKEQADNFCDLTGVNLQAAGLAEVDFTNICLNGALLQGANLAHAKLKNARCLGAQFAGCDLTRTDFSSSNLTGSDLTGSGINDDDNSLSKPPIFTDTILVDSDLSGMDLSNTVFIGCIMNSANLSGCSLTNSAFRSSSHQPCSLTRSIMRSVELSGTQFDNVDLTLADLSYSEGNLNKHEERIKFYNCSLYKTSMRGILLKNVDFEQCKISKCDFSDSDISNSIIKKCDSAGIFFSGADLENVTFEMTHIFQGIDFSDATLRKVIFIGKHVNNLEKDPYPSVIFDRADIINSQLKNMFLSIASFRSAFIDRTNFSNVVLNKCTFEESFLRNALCDNVYFFYTDFLAANIEGIISCKESLCLFLGCQFNESLLPLDVRNIIHVDSLFKRLSSTRIFTKENVFKKGCYINCRLEDIKYFDISETDDFEHSSTGEGKSITEIIKSIEIAIESNYPLINNARGLHAKFKRLYKLEHFIPEHKLLKKSGKFFLVRQLCRELRKDFLRQGYSDLASKTYIQEMEYELKRKLTECKFLGLKINMYWLSCIKSRYIFLFAIIFSSVAAWLARYNYPFIVFWPIILVLLSLISSIRLFFTKHLYKYGESFGQLLVSALICIFSFSVLYYAFLPGASSETQLSQKSSIISTSKLAVKAPKVGCLKDENTDIMIESDNYPFHIFPIDFLALGKCVYFSGVTFTTLGFGDITPRGLVRFLAMLEAGIGAFLMALFVFSFTRRNALR